jgi:hypothetical protein
MQSSLRFPYHLSFIFVQHSGTGICFHPVRYCTYYSTLPVLSVSTFCTVSSPSNPALRLGKPVRTVMVSLSSISLQILWPHLPNFPYPSPTSSTPRTSCTEIFSKFQECFHCVWLLQLRASHQLRLQSASKWDRVKLFCSLPWITADLSCRIILNDILIIRTWLMWLRIGSLGNTVNKVVYTFNKKKLSP